MSDANNQHTLSRRNLLKATLATSALAASGGALAAKTKPLPDDITWMPGIELRHLIAKKTLSPVEVVEHFLNRIDRLEPTLHAYITVDHEGARAQAKEAEAAVMRGDSLGPLHGLPISIKDLYDTKGLRTTQGSMIYKDYIPDSDEILVERLRKAGAIILGKTQTPEFATFPRTKTLLAGETHNPWDTSRITGASSGGSGVAVAAGMSCFSIGSDGGGSTRIPSCFNGVFGLQPSAGRLPMRIPRPVHMASAGPMSLHVRDSAALIQVMSGKDHRDPSAIESSSPDFLGELDKGVDGYRIAWSRDWGCIPDVEPRVTDTIAAAAKLFGDAGAHLDNPNIVLPDDKAWSVFLTINETSYHRGGRLLDFTPEQQALLTPPTQQMLEQVKNAQKISSTKHIEALKNRAELAHWMDGIFEKYDLICTPTLGIVAPKIPDAPWDQPYLDPYYARHISTSYTYIVNVLGLAAASVPCGFVDGLPVGLQIIGPRFADLKVMRAAQAFSKLKPWMNTHPALAS